MEKYGGNENMMGYKGEGEWGLRALVRGEDVLKTYRVKSSM